MEKKTKIIIGVTAGIVALGGLYLAFRPKNPNGSGSNTNNTNTNTVNTGNRPTCSGGTSPCPTNPNVCYDPMAIYFNDPCAGGGWGVFYGGNKVI